jgi:putative transcriptional regulator
MKHEKLYERRIQKGYTDQQLADSLKISKSYYCQIENGKRTLSYELAYKISKILKSKPDELFYSDYKQKET